MSDLRPYQGKPKPPRCGAPCDTERDYDEHPDGEHVCARRRGHAIKFQDPEHWCRCGHGWSPGGTAEVAS